MAGSWKGKWGGAWGGGAWNEDWQGSRPWKGSGGKKGKGKWGGAEEAADAGEGAGLQSTHRILSRYQLSKAILKTAADVDGSAFVKDSKHKVDDFTFLSKKHLRRTLSAENHHLLRRPGVGLSEAAGSIAAGADVLAKMDKVAWEKLATVLGGLRGELQALNTLDASVDRSEEILVAALTSLRSSLTGPDVEEVAIQAAIAGSRLFLMSAHLLPLAAALGDPSWWGGHVPDTLSDHKRFAAWKRDPGDSDKMLRAMAALLLEKIEESTTGKNDPTALFARKAPAAKMPSTDSGSSEPKKKTKKDRKGKKDKKAEKKAKKKAAKKRKASSSSTSSSSPKKPGRAKAPKGGTVKVRRVTASHAGKAIVKEDDLYDELPQDGATTVQAALEKLFAAQSSVEELANWSVQSLAEDGTLQPADTSVTTDVCGDLALLRKGG
ncbi:unnamed protein product [Durusdinium trenchii]|uniref:Uncharacterized protein n=1 Tax=Durusdinium trenchii TaxID=1381693 RepID=A0ABP0PC00_9DINO